MHGTPELCVETLNGSKIGSLLFFLIRVPYNVGDPKGTPSLENYPNERHGAPEPLQASASQGRRTGVTVLRLQGFPMQSIGKPGDLGFRV